MMSHKLTTVTLHGEHRGTTRCWRTSTIQTHQPGVGLSQKMLPVPTPQQMTSYRREVDTVRVVAVPVVHNS